MADDELPDLGKIFLGPDDPHPADALPLNPNARCKHQAALRERANSDEQPVSVPVAAGRYLQARQIVDQQAEDEGLWFVAETAAEAYLQQELRQLHAVIEGTSDD